MEVDRAQEPPQPALQQAQQAQPLPLDSTACAAYRVPDQPPPASCLAPAVAAAEAGQGPAGEATAAAAAAGAPAQPAQPAQPANDPAAAIAGQAPPAALLGWEELRQRLLEAGANPAYASVAWLRNHYRWVSF